MTFDTAMGFLIGVLFTVNMLAPVIAEGWRHMK